MKKISVLLLAFLPLAAALHYFFSAGAVWVFVTGGIAVAVLADWVRRAAEALAAHAGPGVGGLLAVSFGSATELFLGFFVLLDYGAELVRAQITGSIMGTSLLGLGLAIFGGGMRFDRQTFKRERASLLASMLVLVVIALLLPAVFDFATGARLGGQHAPPISDVKLSLAVSSVLLILYAGSLVFAFVTHREIFAAREREQPDEEAWGISKALAILASATLAAAFGAEIVSSALEAAGASLGLPPLFLALVPLALAGTSSDLVAAFSFGRRDRMDLVMSICVGSAIQSALVIAPLLVLVSWAAGAPMTLVFSDPLQLFAIFCAVLIVNTVARDGETTWFEGLLLTGVYVLFAFAFFFTDQPP
jgi:Ca2+:H+ antiporter